MSNKVLTIFVAVISVIGAILFGRVVAIDTEQAAELSAAVSPLITFSIVLFGLSVAAALIASLLGVFKNPDALKKTLLGLVGLVVVLLVSYLMADSSEVVDAEQKVIAAANSAVTKLTSAGIWASIVLLAIAGAFFVFDLVKGLVK
ncbi:hypothetical protein [Tenacibaculum geojense]|uniref:Uncharacterized protein n=1 Tax=Tenacibaculum geojense TaxID=915352 RepID=A0ABW3JPU9_9FLAO